MLNLVCVAIAKFWEQRQASARTCFVDSNQPPWLKLREIMAENLDLFEDYDNSFEFEGFTAEELGEDSPSLDKV